MNYFTLAHFHFISMCQCLSVSQPLSAVFFGVALSGPWPISAIFASPDLFSLLCWLIFFVTAFVQHLKTQQVWLGTFRNLISRLRD